MSKSQLGAAYKDYLEKAPNSVGNLIAIVRQFAYGALYQLEQDAGFRSIGTAETVDDWANVVSLKVWAALRKGTAPDNFPAWVRRIVKNQRHDATRHLIEQRAHKVPLFVSGHDDYTPNVPHEINPAILPYAPTLPSPDDHWRGDLYHYRANPKIPTWTYIRYDDGTEDSTDAVISHLVLNGQNYEDIAEWFGRKLSAFAIRQRIERLKQKAPDKDSLEWRQPRRGQKKQPARWFRDPLQLRAKICSTIREPDAPTCYRCFGSLQVAA